MGIEYEEEESTPEEVTPKPKHSLRNIAIGVATIAIVLVAVFAYLHFSEPAQTSQPSWLKTGTYAVYEGTTTDSAGPMNLTLRLEIVDFNATYARLQMSAKVASEPTTEPAPATVWLETQSMKYILVGENSTGTGEASIQYKNEGTKNCKTYEFNYSGTTTTFYADKKSGWILQIAFSDGQTNIDFNLLETNVPGL